jgi:hypothetical protein
MPPNSSSFKKFFLGRIGERERERGGGKKLK